MPIGTSPQPTRRRPVAGDATRDAAGASSAPAPGQVCTCASVRRLARRVTQIYDRVLAPSGLRVTQFSLLATMLGHDAMPIGTLAAMLDMDRTTLTRNLKPLVDAGLLSIGRSAGDARQREARVTPEGRARHAEARRLWRRAQDEIERTLGTSRVAALHRLSNRVIDALDTQQATGTPRAARRKTAIEEQAK